MGNCQQDQQTRQQQIRKKPKRKFKLDLQVMDDQLAEMSKQTLQRQFNRFMALQDKQGKNETECKQKEQQLHSLVVSKMLDSQLVNSNSQLKVTKKYQFPLQKRIKGYNHIGNFNPSKEIKSKSQMAHWLSSLLVRYFLQVSILPQSIKEQFLDFQAEVIKPNCKIVKEWVGQIFEMRTKQGARLMFNLWLQPVFMRNQMQNQLRKNLSIEYNQLYEMRREQDSNKYNDQFLILPNIVISKIKVGVFNFWEDQLVQQFISQILTGAGFQLEFICKPSPARDFQVYLVISNQRASNHLSEDTLRFLLNQHKNNKGILLFASNQPFCIQANQILQHFKIRLEGALLGGDTLKICQSKSLKLNTFDGDHPVSSGLIKLPKLQSSSFIQNLENFKAFGVTQEGNVVMAYKELDVQGGRVWVDCCQKKLLGMEQQNFQEATAQYLINVLCYLYYP